MYVLASGLCCVNHDNYNYTNERIKTKENLHFCNARAFPNNLKMRKKMQTIQKKETKRGRRGSPFVNKVKKKERRFCGVVMYIILYTHSFFALCFFLLFSDITP